MNQYGVLGNEVIVPAHALVEYPSNLTPVEATSIRMQYLTPYGVLVEFGQVKKGEFVLITAASSSAGLAAIQIVKAEGAISIATTRTGAKRGELLALGADQLCRGAIEEFQVLWKRRSNQFNAGNLVAFSVDRRRACFIPKQNSAKESEEPPIRLPPPLVNIWVEQGWLQSRSRGSHRYTKS